MKRKSEIENSEMKKRQKPQTEPEPGIGDDHSAWAIIIRKLDYQSQFKLSHQSQTLAEVVQLNAESELRKFKRQIREDKYIARQYSNPKKWSFYRALIWIFEEQDEQIQLEKDIQSPIAILVKAESLAEKLECCDDSSNETEEFLYHFKRIRLSQTASCMSRLANNDWEIKPGNFFTKSED